MRNSLAKLVLFLFCLSLACAVPQLLAKNKKKKDAPAESTANEPKRAVHALNRLTFGPRPGDVQEVMAMGVDAWINLQLHPEKIEDPNLAARLAPFRTLRMSSRELVQEFPPNPAIRQVMDGKKSMPSDPARRAIFQVQVARLEHKKDIKQDSAGSSTAPAAGQSAANSKMSDDPAAVASAGDDAATSAKTAEELAAAASASGDSDSGAMNAPNGMTAPNATSSDGSSSGSADMSTAAPANSSTATSASETKSDPAEDRKAQRRENRRNAELNVQAMLDLPPDQRYKKVLAMSADDQIAFAETLRGGKGQEFLDGMDSQQKEVLRAMNNPDAVVLDELSQAKLMRAIYSERQLQEVMTDFWFNHFNVFANKGADRVLITSYEQDVLRPRALGSFEDLLVATAKSPAMLFYLDNWLSLGPNSMKGLGIPGGGPYRRFPRYPGPNPNGNGKGKKESGLNENYGRELLELHTLSVNGGYSQRDVTEVAKVFTGWTIEEPFDGASFRFNPRMHEPGPKFVLGKKISGGGEDEGREVLHMLATSPQTAHFISLKLAQRFVSDDPPAELVDHMAKTFEEKKGDIREVLSTLFHSPEFWSDGAYRAKVKTPLEFVASAARASGAEVEDAQALENQLNKMGMPLFLAQPPTGYSMKADVWVSSGALLNRMNFALALTAGKIRNVKVDSVHLTASPPVPADAATALAAAEANLLTSDVSKQTHDSILAQIESSPKPRAVDPQNQDEDQNQNKDQGKAQSKSAATQRPSDVNVIVGLLLGSPEFQKR